MGDWLDDLIREAMERGDFDNLAGAGKPLRMEENRLLPPEWRLAYRIMRDNDVQPEWISLHKEIESALAQARTRLRGLVRAYEQCQARYDGKKDAESVLRRIMAQEELEAGLGEFRQALGEINRQIQTLNLKVPLFHLTRNLLDIEKEVQALLGTS
jgi:DnaJ family protein C protein 28